MIQSKIIILIYAIVFIRINGKCISYGQCGLNEYNNARNCYYDGPPKVINDTNALKGLKALCPWYFAGNVEFPSLCCDVNQIKTMVGLSQLPKLVVSRCPACWRNLRQFMCARACSENMDEFESVATTVPFIDEHNISQMAIKQTNLAVNYDFMEAIMKSCQHVMFLGASALIPLCMSSECTPEKLVNVLSSPENGAPHSSNIFLTNLDVNVNNTILKPLFEITYACDQAIITENEIELQCTCSDCLTSCPVYDFNISNVEMIGSISVTNLLIIGIVLTVIISLCAMIFHNIWQNRAMNNVNKDDLYWTWQDKISKSLYSILSNAFFQLAVICSTYPIITIIISLLCCIILSLGLTHFKATSDPIDLWGVLGGRCLREKEYFDQHFGPFYRTTQVILVPKNQSQVIYNDKSYGPVFRHDQFLELLDIQTAINNIVVIHNNEPITLQDICFAPLSPDNPNCAIQDVAQYYQNDRQKLLQPNWMDHILKCIDSYYSTDCLSVYLSPVFPYVAFGGVKNKDYLNSKALTITLLITNHLSLEKLAGTKLWEKAFLDYMKGLKSSRFDLYFNAERSAEDGITEVSKSDIATILSSYILMFVYMSIFLSTFRSIRTLLSDIRISLGFSCILMIILAVTSSFGFFSFLGYKTTLIVLEVTPFLLLAVGSGDNFIFVKNYVHTFSKSNDIIELKIASNLRQIGPSLLLSSCAQFVAFGIGAIIPVSAVRIFALYSSLAVIIKFCLQITFFIAVFTIDCKRQEQRRWDILCCFKQKTQDNSEFKILFQQIFQKFYSPFLLHKFVRPVVMILFTAWFIISMAFIPYIKIGLDLQVIFPDNSYTRGYLDAVAEYSAVGPPVYVVVKAGYNYSGITKQNQICGTFGCGVKSIINQITQAASYPNQTYIEISPSSWIDDYFSWISSQSCCRVYSNSSEICFSNDSTCKECPRNPKPYDQRPIISQFYKFLEFFLNTNPDDNCPKAGKALFSSSVELFSDSNDVGATNFMAYSTVQRTAEESYLALESSRFLSNRMSKDLRNHFDPTNDEINPIFLYSMVHIYFEQYIGIMQTTMLNLIYSIIGVFVVTLLLLGMDIQCSLAVLIILIFTMGQLMGAMYMGSIELNAISVVNLIMAVGIAVEFYVHMIRDFSIASGVNRIERAKSIVNHIGVFIFIGVTIPELVSVVTMATAKSELFRLYFFKMYLILIITCTLNGLVFLPVFLSYFGPPINKRKVEILLEKCRLQDSKLLSHYVMADLINDDSSKMDDEQ